MTATKQIAKATIAAQGERRFFSRLNDRLVQNGLHGLMSQRMLAEIIAKRAAA